MAVIAEDRLELVIDAAVGASDTTISAHLEGPISEVAAGDELYVTYGGDAVDDAFEVLRVTSLSAGSAQVDRAVSGSAVTMSADDRLPARLCAEVAEAMHWPGDPLTAPGETAESKDTVPVAYSHPWPDKSSKYFIMALEERHMLSLAEEGDLLIGLPNSEET